MARGPRKRGAPPPYLEHKATGQAYATLAGRAVYFGAYGSPESREAYRAFVADWEARQGRAPPVRAVPGTTLAGLVETFLAHAGGHYRRPDGTPTEEVGAFVRNLRDLLGDTPHRPAADYRAVDLEALRREWVGSGLVRKTVNKQVGRVKRCFRWGLVQGLVPPEVVASLDALADLGEGRSAAPDREPVPPADDDAVYRSLPYLTPPVRALVALQYLAGMRPGEACRLRGAELDREGRAVFGRRVVKLTTAGWVFQPRRHKNKSKQKHLAYVLGPLARLVLCRWLRPDPEEYLFQPREWDGQGKPAPRDVKAEKRRKQRKTGGRRKGESYRVDSYAHSVKSACIRAGVPPFSPNQLRHSFATRAEAQFGLLDAAAALGHASPLTTEVYVAKSLARAAAVAEALG